MISRINKLYKSDVKKSKANFRNSTFSLIKDVSLAHSLPEAPILGEKTNSIVSSSLHRRYYSIEVDKQTGPYWTIQQAIDAALPNSLIKITEGFY